MIASLLRRHVFKCSTGCSTLDLVLQGGIPCGSLTEIVGESASAKTQLCLQMLLSVQLPHAEGGLHGSALYVFTESYFPAQRLQDLAKGFLNSRVTGGKCFDGIGDYTLNSTSVEERLAGDCTRIDPHKGAANEGNQDGSTENASTTYPSPCDNIFVEGVQGPVELLNFLDHAETLLQHPFRMPVKLIVIDSFAALFRSYFENTTEDLWKRTQLFFQIASKLKRFAQTYNLAVVVTNHVVDVFESDCSVRSDLQDLIHKGEAENLMTSGRRVAPALGLSWANCVNTRLFLTRHVHDFGDLAVRRSLHVVFAPHLPYTACDFEVCQQGIRGVPRK